MPTPALASWLLTFLLHSTLLATAALVSFVGFGPRIGVPTPEPTGERTIALNTGAGAASTTARAPSRPTLTTPAAMYERPVTERGPISANVAANAGTPVRSIEQALALALITAVGVGAARFLRNTLSARVRLARRRPLERSPEHATHGPRVAALLAALDAPRGVRVTVTRDLDVPLALGRSEVVLPERALVELDTDELRALLAHELAHLARRDPLWLGAARLVQALTWFQPLQRVLLRRLEAESELATDALAVARTQQPLALARTLERVARWLVADPTPALGVAMARRGSTVLARIERLVALREVPAPRSTGNVAIGTLAALAAVACAAPKMTTEARVGLTGAEAFALLTPVIDLAEGSDKPIWRHATSDAAVLDFGEYPWRATPQFLVLHIAHDPEHPEQPLLHAFGQRLQDVDAAAELARLAKDRCPTLYVHVASTPEATEPSVAELQRAMARVDVAASQAVIRDDAARRFGRDLDASRLGLHDPDAPVHVAPYKGPDAEPFEQRFVLRLDERGELRGLPAGQVPLDFVAGRLGAARTGPLDPTAHGPQLEVIQDRLLIECDARTPFDAVLHWIGALAVTTLWVWKTELALAGASDAEVVSVFLPRDAGLADGLGRANGRHVEIEPVTVSELRIDRDTEGLLYRMAQRPGEALLSRDREEVIERAFPQGAQVIPDVRLPVTFGEVLPLLRASHERGTHVTFVGSFSRSSLHQPKD